MVQRQGWRRFFVESVVKVYLVTYNADQNDAVLSAFEKAQIDLYPLPEKNKGRGRTTRGGQHDKQVWTGTKAMVALAVGQEKESSLFKALQEINKNYKEAQIRAFAFEAEELL